MEISPQQTEPHVPVDQLAPANNFPNTPDDPKLFLVFFVKPLDLHGTTDSASVMGVTDESLVKNNTETVKGIEVLEQPGPSSVRTSEGKLFGFQVHLAEFSQLFFRILKKISVAFGLANVVTKPDMAGDEKTAEKTVTLRKRQPKPTCLKPTRTTERLKRRRPRKVFCILKRFKAPIQHCCELFQKSEHETVSSVRHVFFHLEVSFLSACTRREEG